MLGHTPLSATPFASLARRTPVDVRLLLAQRIREHRIAREWTQREMAARAGMAFETYRVFERGGRISFDRFLRILDVLGLLDQVELVPPTPFTSIDEVVNQGSARPRQRVRSPKRQHNYEVPR